jgi:hypothetical protein
MFAIGIVVDVSVKVDILIAVTPLGLTLIEKDATNIGHHKGCTMYRHLPLCERPNPPSRLTLVVL